MILTNNAAIGRDRIQRRFRMSLPSNTAPPQHHQHQQQTPRRSPTNHRHTNYPQHKHQQVAAVSNRLNNAAVVLPQKAVTITTRVRHQAAPAQHRYLPPMQQTDLRHHHVVRRMQRPPEEAYPLKTLGSVRISTTENAMTTSSSRLDEMTTKRRQSRVDKMQKISNGNNNSKSTLKNINKSRQRANSSRFMRTNADFQVEITASLAHQPPLEFVVPASPRLNGAAQTIRLSNCGRKTSMADFYHNKSNEHVNQHKEDVHRKNEDNTTVERNIDEEQDDPEMRAIEAVLECNRSHMLSQKYFIYSVDQLIEIENG